MGFKYENKDTHQLLYELFNLNDKLVTPRKRKVHISKELGNKELPSNYIKYISEIKSKFERGENINRYLGKGSFKPDGKDLLLCEWGIYHLHLNEEVYERGFIKRSAYLLFFMIDENNVYFIDVTKHQIKDRTEFVQSHQLKIVKQNWNFLIEHKKLKGVSPAYNLSDKQHKQLRNKGYSTITEIDGESYALLNGAISSAKTNIMYTRESFQVHQVMRDIEKDLLSRKEHLKMMIAEYGLIEIEFSFKLVAKNK